MLQLDDEEEIQTLLFGDDELQQIEEEQERSRFF
jgi:hypothetical protein